MVMKKEKKNPRKSVSGRNDKGDSQGGIITKRVVWIDGIWIGTGRGRLVGRVREGERDYEHEVLKMVDWGYMQWDLEGPSGWVGPDS